MRTLLLLWLVAGCCTARIQAREDLAPLLESHLTKTKFPAIAAAVVRGTNIVAAGAVGVRKAGSAEKVTLDDKFHIGSCTKSMTALLAAFLDAEGDVRLTNTVAGILSDWRLPGEAHEITLALLLQNYSGLGNDPDNKLWQRAYLDPGTPEAQRRRFLEGFLKSPLAAKPGEKYLYSNIGYALAGAMLETAAKKSWEKLVREKIFNRLHLKSGGFGPPSATGEVDQPWGHIWSEGRAVSKEPSDNPFAIAPAGAVHLSILDCARYAAYHLAAAQGKIPELRPYRDQLYKAPEGSTYAMGWVVDQRSWARGKIITHAGSNTMFFTVIWIAPNRDFACVVATNIADAENTVAAGVDQIVVELIKKFALNSSAGTE